MGNKHVWNKINKLKAQKTQFVAKRNNLPLSNQEKVNLDYEINKIDEKIFKLDQKLRRGGFYEN